MRRWNILAILLLALSACSQVKKYPDGIVTRVGDGSLKLQVCYDEVIHVAYAKDAAFFDHKSLVVLPTHESVDWHLTSDDQSATVSTSKIQARVDLATGAVTFLDPAGQIILAENPDRRET